MRDRPRFSVGLPVFNGERFLTSAVESILGQSEGDWELILCDNASSDGTEAICRSFAARDARVRYHRNPENIGGAANHNLAVRLARADYFAWGGADDVRHPDYLRRCGEALDADPALVLCHSRTRYIDAEGAELPREELRLDAEAASPHRRFASLIGMEHKVEPVYGLMRTSALRRTGLLGGFSDADRVLMAELSLQGPFRVLPEFLFFRREHAQQSSRVYLTRQARMAWFDPARAGKLSFPHFRQYREYLAAIERAPVEAREKALARAEMRRWLLRNRKRLFSDLGKALSFLAAKAAAKVAGAAGTDKPAGAARK